MTSTSVPIGLIVLIAATFVLQAAPASGPAGASLKIAKGNGSRVTLTFLGATDQRYQAYFSRDLKDWEFLGNIIKGEDRPITLDFNTTKDREAFFRVEARPVSSPVSPRIERERDGKIKLTFPTVVGRKYLVYSTTDLQQWEVFSDLIEGTGVPEAAELDTAEAAEMFFRVESTDVFPLPNMVWIKPGTFVMGSPSDEKDRDLDEDPLTRVVFDRGFWMNKYEVTQREYEQLMGNNPSWFKNGPTLPVEQVSWEEAVAYCSKLTQAELAAGRLPSGYAYRLPTEAEFEYACRAGTTTRYFYGDDLDNHDLADYAWYGVNSGDTSHRVGQKKPNLLGLYDIYGNVWEWCLDWYHDSYPGGVLTKPLGPATGVSRVFRGGGWDYRKAASCRSAYRNNVLPSRRTNYIGFRVVLDTPLP